MAMRPLLLLCLLTLGLPAPVLGAPAKPQVQLLDIQTLKGMLADPGVLIIDVRSSGSWGASARKIPGAVRQDPARVNAWGPTLPRNKTLVLY